MSWGEVFKINKNMKRSLDEQMRDLKFQPIRIITQSTTYTPEKTGLYKVICIGAGGDGYFNDSSNNYSAAGGASGGVAIKTIKLTKATSYNVTVSTTASFSNELTATSGGSSSSGGTGGTATGGDYNFAGKSGGSSNSKTASVKGGSIGVAISDLFTIGETLSGFGYDSSDLLQMYNLRYGDNLLGYGGGGGAALYRNSDTYVDGVRLNGLPAAVLIIPIEMEE